MTTKPATAQTAPRPLGCLPGSVDLPQVKAASRLLTHDGQPLAAFDERDRCLSAGAYLDPRRETGEVVLEFLHEHRAATGREEQHAEQERVTVEYADLFRTAGWGVREFWERNHTGREHLARLILVPGPPTARERMTAALAEHGITAHVDKDAGNSWLLIPMTGSDCPDAGTPHLVAYVYEAHEDWAFVDKPMEHWAGTWTVLTHDGTGRDRELWRGENTSDTGADTAECALFIARLLNKAPR